MPVLPLIEAVVSMQTATWLPSRLKATLWPASGIKRTVLAWAMCQMRTSSAMAPPWIGLYRAGRGQELAVGREGQIEDEIAGVAFQSGQLAAVGDIPDLDGSIASRGGQTVGVGAERKASDMRAQALKDAGRGPGLGVEEGDCGPGAVVNCQIPAVGTECGAQAGKGALLRVAKQIEIAPLPFAEFRRAHAEEHLGVRDVADAHIAVGGRDEVEILVPGLKRGQRVALVGLGLRCARLGLCGPSPRLCGPGECVAADRLIGAVTDRCHWSSTPVTPEMARTMIVSPSAAIAGRRVTHLAIRSGAETGRARMGSWFNHRSRSSAKASAEP